MIQLTVFEEQVLQALSASQNTYVYNIHDSVANSSMIYRQGESLFGEDWAGFECVSSGDCLSHPTLNAALGRLARKGLIVRCASQEAANQHRSWAVWKLTELGAEVTGISLTLESQS